MNENQDALTKFLPDAHKRAIENDEHRGRTKIIVRGQITDNNPNPTNTKDRTPGA
ncbi:MAG: amidohydrolase, partial [Acidimicrobiia bacterium]